jgi:transcriptional regulator with XRE-family HTH domain
MKKSTTSIDVEVGSRVRMRRMTIGMSQEKLGEMLGLTFQQVQKYEKGTNRISVSRLVDIADVLGVEIDYFFKGLRGPKSTQGLSEPESPPYASEVMSTPEGLQLIRTFATIRSGKIRRSLVQLVSVLATSAEAPDEEDERSS